MDFTAFKFSTVASAADIEDRKCAALASLHPQESKQAISGPTITEELLSYLKIISDHPGIQATKRDRLAGFSLRKGSHLRKQLLKLGLIEEFQANPGGRGRAFTDVRLTEKGQGLLAENKTEQKYV